MAPRRPIINLSSGVAHCVAYAVALSYTARLVSMSELSHAAIGLLGAAIGYFGKNLLEMYHGRRALRADRIKVLKRLAVLIDEGSSVRRTQRYLANALYVMVEKNHPAEVKGTFGYDQAFLAAFSQFSAEERDLHALLRSTTIHSALRIHTALREWAESSTDIIGELPESRSRTLFGQHLAELKEYLNGWFSVYYARVQDDLRRPDVFMREGQPEGQPQPALFPREIAASVGGLISDLRS